MMGRRRLTIGLFAALFAAPAYAGGTTPSPQPAAVPQPFGATPARYDTVACSQFRAKQQQAIEGGILADLQRGPDWAQSNLAPARLVEIESYIALDEQLKFGCREAVLSPDAQQARDAAKKLEANPDADPNAPVPAPAKPKSKPAATGTPKQGAAVEGGFDPTPRAVKDSAAKEKVLLKPKRERRTPDAFSPAPPPQEAVSGSSSGPSDAAANGGEAILQFNAAPAAAAAREAPARKWVPIGDKPANSASPSP